jgi:ADP-L-glycero-D-manno-heptose 6-epimerase
MAVDREHLFDWLRSARPRLRAIVHLGACTNTLETDERYLAEANTRYSMLLWRYAVQMQTPFLYASSAATYGDGSSGYDDAEELLPRLRPLNAYGRSKHAFDLWALEQEGMGQAPPRWAGFKFFNVYGAGERHKGVMASVVLHAFDQIRREGTVRLFRSHRADVPDGWQQRDFVAVEDVIQVLHFALARGIARGLFNLGSGRARSFLDLTRIVFETLEVPLAIEFIETPAALRDRYQYFTQARMDKLRRQGYLAEFRSLEAGVSAYVRHLLQEDTEPDGIPPHRRPSPS